MSLDEVRFMFGSCVRSLRERRGWTQEQLAARLGDLLGVEVDPLKVGRTEKGMRPVALEEAMAFAAALDTTLNDLLAATTDADFTKRLADRLEAGMLVERLCDAIADERAALQRLGEVLQKRPGLQAAIMDNPSVTAEAMALLKSAVAGRAGDGDEKEGQST